VLWVLVAAATASCRRSVDPPEVTGRWVMVASEAADTLDLFSDGRFRQSFRHRNGRRAEGVGRWSLSEMDGQQRVSLDSYHRWWDAYVPPGSVGVHGPLFFSAPVRRARSGQLKLILDADGERAYVHLP